MKFFRYLMLALAVVFVANSASAQNREVVTWKVKTEHVKDDVFRITFDVDIIDGYHIYDLGPYEMGPIATSFTFEANPNIELVGGVKPVKPVEREHDDVWGFEVGYFYGKTSFTQDVRLKSERATLKGEIEWQACDDMSCMPPGDYEFSVQLVRVAPAAGAATPPAAATGTGTTGTTAAAPPVAVAVSDNANEATGATEEDAVVEEVTVSAADDFETAGGHEEERKGLWGKIITAIIWGFVSLVTPCVFPMVPITVAFFLKGGENKALARFRASAFGFFIIVLYTLPIFVITIVAELMGGASGAAGMFNWLGTHWLPNIIFFIIFLVFAAAFFGAFEITLPGSIVNKTDAKADKKGLVGVFFLALTLVLISFSCTAPIVGNVIVDATTTSTTWWEPVVVMLFYAVAFAIPFTLLAFVPSLLDKMKSGSWMNSVKVSIGFVEVVLAFKFLMIIDQAYGLNLMSREFNVAIWIACGLLWSLYLLGVYKTKYDSDLPYVGPLRLTFAITVMVITLWMIPGLWGAPLKPLSGYLQPMTAQSFTVASAEELREMQFTGGGGSSDPMRFDGRINPLTGQPPRFSTVERMKSPIGFPAFFDVEEATEFALHVNKPLFIDITGVACVNCREVEQNVWTDPRVRQLLREEFVMVCVYMDIKYEMPERYWMTMPDGRVLKRLDRINVEWARTNFGTVGMPEYIMLDPRDGSMLGPKRAWTKDIQGYANWLQAGLDLFRSR